MRLPPTRPEGQFEVPQALVVGIHLVVQPWYAPVGKELAAKVAVPVAAEGDR